MGNSELGYRSAAVKQHSVLPVSAHYVSCDFWGDYHDIEAGLMGAGGPG